MKRFVVSSVFAAAVFAAVAGSARAQEIQFGLRGAFIAHSTYELDEENNHHYNPGLGYGAGLVVKYAVSDELSFVGNPSFYWRSLYSYKNGNMPESIDEMALCIPLTANYNVTLDVYLSGGLELDVPFGTQEVNRGFGKDISDKRAAVDVGFLIGGGYMIKENFGVDARYVIYFNKPRKDPELLMSYGIGVFLLF